MSVEPGCVVVGAGLAAAHVVQTLREKGYGEPITLVGQERERPYERPALSKEYLQGKLDADALYVHGEGWYAEHDIDTAFGRAATSIDRRGARVLLDSGEPIGYRHLVLATGSSPRTPDLPGIDLAGTYTLRTREDSDAIRAGLTERRRVVVIGAGWIGLEVAAAARHHGNAVTVVEPQPTPLHAVLGAEMGQVFAR
ncbi:MAG: NAD(P)/FAD-dependent oxidoreductase, partial [Nocardioidaceae bacterium]